jgi:hypothetical protein
VFLRGCTSAVPLDDTLPAWGDFAFSLEVECSSLGLAREVEKCLEDGPRERGGPVGAVLGAGGWVVAADDDWAEDVFARKRDWLEWFEK